MNIVLEIPLSFFVVYALVRIYKKKKKNSDTGVQNRILFEYFLFLYIILSIYVSFMSDLEIFYYIITSFFFFFLY